MQYTTLTHLPNGNIRFQLTTEGKELYNELNAADEEHPMKNDADYFLDFIESYLCNGWRQIQPGEIGALTESLLLGDYSDSVWYFNDYMIRSYMDALNSQWGIEFTKA